VPEANVKASSRPRQAGPVLRIRNLRLDGPSVRCATDGEDVLVPRIPASYLRPGDDLRVAVFSSPIHEYLATQNGLRRQTRQLYFGRIGYVAQPKADKRGEHFVRAEVLESALGIRSLHLPNSSVRDYFYFFTQTPPGKRPPTLYEVLRTRPTATPADLRLSYRICRLEHESDSAAKPEIEAQSGPSISWPIPTFAPVTMRCCETRMLRRSSRTAASANAWSLANCRRMELPFSYGGSCHICRTSGNASFALRYAVSNISMGVRSTGIAAGKLRYISIPRFFRSDGIRPGTSGSTWCRRRLASRQPLSSPANTETGTANGIW